jgi:hypothetical protein
LGDSGEKLQKLEDSVSSVHRDVDSVPPKVASIRAELSRKIASEAALRLKVAANLAAQTPAAATFASNAFGAAQSSRDAIKQTFTTKRQDQVAAAEQSVQAAVNNEVSRAALDAPNLSTAVAAASTAVAGVQSSTLASESARANQNCTDKIAAVISSQPVPAAASGKDYTTWFVILLDVAWSHFRQHVLGDRNALLLLDQQAYLCMLYVSSSCVRLISHDSQLARSGKHSTMAHSPTPPFSLCSSKSCCMV